MSAEIVNLRRMRKRKAREDRELKAESNRAKFGTPKPVRDKASAERRLAARRLEAHKREE
jgi:Domain of unknown function (DUF4169)